MADVAHHIHVHNFFDPVTSTATHVVSGGDGTPAAIIDSVLDYDLKSGRTSRTSADKVIAYVQEHKLSVEWILETHVHADHLTAAQYLKQKLGGKVGIGAQVKVVQEVFGKLFNLPDSVPRDGSQFDHLFADGETFRFGELEAKVMNVPGHTPADVCYVIEGIAFVGDSIFHPDVGSARCDFPGGDARQLYKSVHKILALPPTTRLFLCHDYPSEGRTHVFSTTVRVCVSHTALATVLLHTSD